MKPRSWTGTAQAPVSMQVVEPRQPEPHGHHLITRWIYNPGLHGHRLCIEFKSAEVYRKHHVRWRTSASAWMLTATPPRGIGFSLIGWFGGVPVRFEMAWEECWHTSLREDVHFVTATRTTLLDVL
jgi:hypothetical protein